MTNIKISSLVDCVTKFIVFIFRLSKQQYASIFSRQMKSIVYVYISRLQVTYDFMLLQGMPDLRKHDPKKYLDSLHVSSICFG